MSVSSSDSSFSSSSFGQFFDVFSFGGEDFRSANLPVPPRTDGEGRAAASSFKNSLSREHVRTLAVHFFVPPDLEIAVPRRGDTVLHPQEGFCALYIDHFKVGLRLPLFPFLLVILAHYEIALPQLVPKLLEP